MVFKRERVKDVGVLLLMIGVLLLAGGFEFLSVLENHMSRA
jgi:hypothetical protein